MLTSMWENNTWKIGLDVGWWRVAVAPSPALLPSLAAARLPAPRTLGRALKFLDKDNNDTLNRTLPPDFLLIHLSGGVVTCLK